MPDPRKPNRGWQLYVDDMIECMRKIQSYTKQMDKAAFIACLLYTSPSPRDS